MNLNNTLFIDTESNPVTKKPESLQWLIGNEKGIITDFTKESYKFIKNIFDKCDSIIMFNAPYDMGVLSIMYDDNSYKWMESEDRGSYWNIKIFKHVYNVRKLGFHRNLIKPLKMDIGTTKTGKRIKNGKRKTSKPIIDLLKLWSILIDDGRGGSIRLKELIKRILKKDAIPYTEENSQTEAYRYQDVICLRELAEYFFNHVASIDDLKDYDFNQWGYIKTPATFTKLSYDDNYPIFECKPHKIMEDRISRFPLLDNALEKAFNGGLTLSFYRGTLNYTGWVDISGAYVHAIEFLNTDSYILADIIEHDGCEWNYKQPNCLIQIKTNFVIKSMNKSLKVFSVKEPCKLWVWYNDIVACEMLKDDFEYEVIKGFEFIPEHETSESLPAVWSRLKDEEKQTHGKTTLYDFFKFKGNTGYGITAQRKPFKTKYTNMIIAGMITSTVHMILAKINNTINNYGGKIGRVLYNDTDSAAFEHDISFSACDMDNLVKTINDRISPYTVESEGYGKKTTFLSLKRYISEGGTDKDKIKLHGKGRYNVYQKEIYDYVINQTLPKKELQVTQLGANTQRGMNQILNLYPYLDEYKHPFMFVTNVPTDRTMREFFESWYYHIDTKTTFNLTGEFYREFRTFNNLSHARDFFTNYKEDIEHDDMNTKHRDYDKELILDFK